MVAKVNLCGNGACSMPSFLFKKVLTKNPNKKDPNKKAKKIAKTVDFFVKIGYNKYEYDFLGKGRGTAHDQEHDGLRKMP